MIASNGSGSTATAVWRQLTVEEAEAGLVTADILAVRRWWLEERRQAVVFQMVKTAVVCPSAGSSALREYFQRSPDMLC